LLNNQKIEKLLIFALGAGLGVWILYRAVHLSFTHDESLSYLTFHDKSLGDLFLNFSCWQSANNHILNTILFKASISLFGLSDFAMRLPNLLAFLGSFYIAYKITQQHLTNPFSKMVLLAVLFLNPYVIDFYSLCRGYGLSMFFQLSSIYFLLTYLKWNKKSSLHYSFICLGLATLSLFTNAILFPVFGLSLWIIRYKNLRSAKELILAPLVWGLVTLVLIWKPIGFLRQKDEFKYGATNLWESFQSFIKGTLDEQGYLLDADATLLVVLLCFLVSLAFSHFILLKSKTTYRFFPIAFILLLGLLHIALAADVLLPVVRKTTLYVPLIACLFSFSVNQIKMKAFSKTVIGLILILISAHFISTTKSYQTIEWKYDRLTKDYIFRLKEENRNFILQTYWKFHPTSEYYVISRKIKNISVYPRNNDFKLAETATALMHYEWETKTYPEFTIIEENQELSLAIKK
jgi:4-amino-4-deoxy-L-arabinose transferase-like glycosyltransferase